MTFSYVGDQITLVSEQLVAMVVQPSRFLSEAEIMTQGFSFVVRDANGNPIYSRIMEDPIQHDVEVFGTESNQSVGRVAATRPKGTFVILAPDAPEARTLEFYGHAPLPERSAMSSGLLASFTLAPLKRKRKRGPQ
jgi:hypothetical protein